jgi:hypothetical protein
MSKNERNLEALNSRCWNIECDTAFDTTLKVCGRCGTAKYCSRLCQKDHWKHHQHFCKGGAAHDKNKMPRCVVKDCTSPGPGADWRFPFCQPHGDAICCDLAVGDGYTVCILQGCYFGTMGEGIPFCEKHTKKTLRVEEIEDFQEQELPIASSL